MQLTSNQTKAVKARKGNFLVSASAGSGKTAVLTERVYEVIVEGTNLDELLVLTFTNAAASEMRDRIRQKLVDTGDPKLFQIASNLDAANIQTYDAFALNIVKKYYYVLNLPKDINLVDKTVLTLQERKILDEILNKHFDEKDENVLRLISEYCLKNADNLKSFIIDVSHKFDLKENKQQFLDTYIENFFKEEKIIEEIKTYVDSIIDNIHKFIKKIKTFDNVDYVDAILPILERMAASNSYESLKAALTSEDNKFPSLRGALSLNDYPDDKAYHDHIKDSLKKYVKMLRFDSLEDALNQYLGVKENTKTIIGLTKELDAELAKFKQKYDVYTFSDVFKFATNIVSIPEINKELKNKFKYIMIDEYQDTSDSQENFINLIANDNVYVVGDVKQSIYRFRNANCDLFLDKFNRYGKGDGGIRIELPENFRSRKEVVEAVNKVFSPVMTNLNTGLDYKNEHVMIHGNRGYISANSDYSLQILNYSLGEKYLANEHEARLIATDILKKINDGFEVFDRELGKLRKADFKDFAIIMYSKKSFPIYQKVFNEYQIPLYADYDKSIRENNLTMTIENIVSLIELFNEQDFSKKFLHSYISVLRSFLFSTSDQEIENLVYDKQYDKFPLYQILEKTCEESKSKNLRDQICLIVKNFDIYNKLITIGDISKNVALLEYYFSIASQMDKMGYTIKEFKQYFDDLKEFEIDPEYSPTDDVSNCVKLLTIHASKGLQFKICYFAELSKKFNNQSQMNRFLVDSTYGIDIPNVNHKEISSMYHTLIASKEIHETLLEQLRVFYVALTRAEEKIILLKNINYRKRSIQEFEQCSCFLDFIAVGGETFASYEEDISLQKRSVKEKKKEIKQITIAEPIVLSNEQKENKHASKELDDDTSDELLLLGEKYHYYLQLTDFVSKDTSFIKDEKDKKRIDKFLSNPLFDNLKGAKIMHEYPFFDEKNNVSGVIDLLIVHKDHVDIVDFKLSHVDDEMYEKQVEAYKNYISQLVDIKINTYILGILSNKIKKVS